MRKLEVTMKKIIKSIQKLINNSVEVKLHGQLVVYQYFSTSHYLYYIETKLEERQAFVNKTNQ